MRALLDTCVVSELRRSSPNARVLETIQELPDEHLYLSAVSVGEITKGVYILPESKKRRELESWLLTIERDYADRILPIDTELVHVWGELTAVAQNEGRPIPILDALIAATALRHGLHLITRNSSDFEATGVLLVNPWLE